jgi:drug/metabolite transporter (DMT)-like permease
VQAVALGLLAAVLWAVSSLASSRGVRMVPPTSFVAWAMLVGLVVSLPFTVATGVPPALGPAQLAQFALAGTCSVAGLVLGWGALRYGKIGIVTPIVSAEGAIAAVIAALMGESIAPAAAVLLGAIAIGVAIAAIAPDPAPLEHERPVLAVGMAVAAAVVFGLSLYTLGRLSGELPLSWVVLPPRVAGVALLFLPLLITRRLRLTRQVAPLVVLVGLTEVGGHLSYALGARDSIAVAAVLACQFALIAAVLAYVLFRERLGRLQITAIAILVAGVTGLTFLTA